MKFDQYMLYSVKFPFQNPIKNKNISLSATFRSFFKC